MKKHTAGTLTIIFCFCILAPAIISCSKNEIAPEQKDSFIKFFGTTGLNTGADVKQTSDGGYIVLGSYPSKNKGTNMYLVKTDALGNEQWSRQYGDSANNVGNSLQITSDGYILLGTITRAKQTDMYLVRVKSNGDTLWTMSFGTAGNEVAYCVTVTNDGGYLVAGSTATNSAGLDAYWALVSPDGKLQWSNSYGSPTDDWIESAVQTSDGYVLLGTTSNPLLSQGLSDIFVLKIRKDGSPVNSATLGTTGADFGSDIHLLPDGSFLCSGSSTPNGKTNSEMLLYNFNINNSAIKVIWQKSFALDQSITCQSLSIDNNNNYWLTGTLTRSDGNQDVCLVKTDSNGNSLWNQTFGDTGNQTGEAVFVTSDGGAVIVGSNEINDNSMVMLLKVKKDGSL